VTADAGRAEGPYLDIQALIRATHDGLVRAAFRLLGNRADAEDAVQEGCIKVMRNWPRVSRLPTARQQRAYLLTAVVNEALQILRQPYRKRERLEGGRAENARITERPDEAGQAAGEHLRLVWKAISELPEGRREVVILFAAGYEYREIAKALGVQVSTVRSHVSNARKQLPRAVPYEMEGGSE
jgi:RNA polymerase sigma-70 factor (ECF subfamily)